MSELAKVQNPVDRESKQAGMMTVEEVAQRIAMSDSFVYGAIADGRLKHHRFGKGQGGIRISELQLAAFLADTERGGETAKEETPQPADDTRPAPRAKGQKVELW